MLNQQRFGGYTFAGGTHEELAAQILSWLRDARRPPRLIGYLNPRVFNESRRNDDVRRFLQRCDLLAVDGVGIVLAAALFRCERLPRAWMAGLFDAVVASPKARGAAILIGASPDENEAALRAMRSVAPALDVVAGYDGYREAADYAAILARHVDIDLVLVGMGCPKSETLLLQAVEICSRALCWNIGGGTVRYYAGAKQRPPGWVQRAGLQWAYRMLREPAVRRRYLVDIPKFVYYSARSRR